MRPAFLPPIFLDATSLPKRPLRHLVGVSGGMDSVVLLHGLHAAGFKNLIVCHLDHRLRGRASAGDAAFVRKLATKLGFPAEVGKTDVSALARREKLSVENAARQARQEFFFECAARRRCWRLILAHHADDQVETILQNIFRGGGLAGVAGMRSISTLRIPSSRRILTIHRPLLRTTRAELAAYSAEQGLKFRHDASNDSPAHQRNRIRHQFIPQIRETIGRDPTAAILRLGEIARCEDDFLTELAAAFPLGDRLAVSALREQPPAMQRRILHEWMKQQGVRNIGFDLIEAVRQLLPAGAKTARVNLTGGKFVRRTDGLLYIC